MDYAHVVVGEEGEEVCFFEEPGRQEEGCVMERVVEWWGDGNGGGNGGFAGWGKDGRVEGF